MNKAESSGVNPTELAEKIENLQVAGESDGGEKLFGSGAVSPMAGSKVRNSLTISFLTIFLTMPSLCFVLNTFNQLKDYLITQK